MEIGSGMAIESETHGNHLGGVDIRLVHDVLRRRHLQVL